MKKGKGAFGSVLIGDKGRMFQPPLNRVADHRRDEDEVKQIELRPKKHSPDEGQLRRVGGRRHRQGPQAAQPF